jgi:hypothetical protein
MTFERLGLSRALFFAVMITTLVGLPLVAIAQERPTAPVQERAPVREATLGTAAAPNTKPIAKRGPSAGQIAMRERRVKCGAEWRTSKAQGTIETGTTWPKFWSACNKRLKETHA